MSAAAREAVRLRVLDGPPPDWDRFLAARVPDAELAAGAHWTVLAARHYPGAWPCWAVAETAEHGLVGGLPALGQRRWALARLESSRDGTIAGPQVAADLPPALQDEVFAALCGWLAGQVGGRMVLAVVTVAADEARRRLTAAAAGPGRKLVPFLSAVVDCRPGPERIDRESWTKNRRNERSRGLKRGCTLHADRDPAVLDQWYPIYRAQAGHWAQAPVPIGFLHDLLRCEPDRVVLTTVQLAGTVIGGHFCLVSRRRLVPFLSGAEPGLLATHFTNTLLYWQDILHASATGLEAVDFGGFAGRDSLWDFKRRCGGVPEERLQLQISSGPGRWLRAAGSLRRRLRRSGP